MGAKKVIQQDFLLERDLNTSLMNMGDKTIWAPIFLEVYNPNTITKNELVKFYQQFCDITLLVTSTTDSTFDDPISYKTFTYNYTIKIDNPGFTGLFSFTPHHPYILDYFISNDTDKNVIYLTILVNGIDFKSVDDKFNDYNVLLLQLSNNGREDDYNKAELNYKIHSIEGSDKDYSETPYIKGQVEFINYNNNGLTDLYNELNLMKPVEVWLCEDPYSSDLKKSIIFKTKVNPDDGSFIYYFRYKGGDSDANVPLRPEIGTTIYYARVVNDPLDQEIWTDKVGVYVDNIKPSISIDNDLIYRRKLQPDVYLQIPDFFSLYCMNPNGVQSPRLSYKFQKNDEWIEAEYLTVDLERYPLLNTYRYRIHIDSDDFGDPDQEIFKLYYKIENTVNKFVKNVTEDFVDLRVETFKPKDWKELENEYSAPCGTDYFELYPTMIKTYDDRVYGINDEPLFNLADTFNDAYGISTGYVATRPINIDYDKKLTITAIPPEKMERIIEDTLHLKKNQENPYQKYLSPNIIISTEHLFNVKHQTPTDDLKVCLDISYVGLTGGTNTVLLEKHSYAYFNYCNFFDNHEFVTINSSNALLQIYNSKIVNPRSTFIINLNGQVDFNNNEFVIDDIYEIKDKYKVAFCNNDSESIMNINNNKFVINITDPKPFEIGYSKCLFELKEGTEVNGVFISEEFIKNNFIDLGYNNNYYLYTVSRTFWYRPNKICCCKTYDLNMKNPSIACGDGCDEMRNNDNNHVYRYLFTPSESNGFSFVYNGEIFTTNTQSCFQIVYPNDTPITPKNSCWDPDSYIPNRNIAEDLNFPLIELAPNLYEGDY